MRRQSDKTNANQQLLNRIIEGDCLQIMPQLADGSIDMILCDLPYGVTNNRWDVVIPLDRLWAEYNRIVKPSGAIVLTAIQPFATKLIQGNLRNFRYEWIWSKHRCGNFLNAKHQPLRAHENILVFYRRRGTYNPQMSTGRMRTVAPKAVTSSNYRRVRSNRTETRQSNQYYPRTILDIAAVTRPVHPTQKPLELWEYLIRTYTNPGETVLDNCAGSGTTAVACETTGRQYICIEQDATYCELARSRIAATR